MVRSSICGSCAAHSGWIVAAAPSSANRARSAGSTTCRWATWCRPPSGPFALRAAATASRHSRTARSPSAWKCTWKPSRSSSVTCPASATGSTKLRPRLPVSAPQPSRYGPSSPAVKFSTTPSCITLTVPAAKPCAAAASRRSDQLGHLLGTAVAVPPLRRDDPGSQLAAGVRAQVDRQRVGLAEQRAHRGVLPGGDAVENITSCAASRPASCSAGVGSGASRSTSATAPSCSVPDGAPVGSRSIRPSGGSGVAAVRPASSSARLLAQAPWPSRLLSSAGRSRTTASRASRVGCRRGSRAIDQPDPRTHGRSGRSPAYAAIRATVSSADLASVRSQRSMSTPAASGCACASWKAGSTSPPRTSTTSVCGPTVSRTSSSVPTSTIRPPAHGDRAGPGRAVEEQRAADQDGVCRAHPVRPARRTPSRARRGPRRAGARASPAAGAAAARCRRCRR